MNMVVSVTIKVFVEVSNRHMHLTEEIYNKLFNTPLDKKKDLSQKGEFASTKTVTIETSKNKIENVRIVGPFRNYNQVEISKSDARILGISPPVRKSGNILDSEAITVTGELGSINLDNCCILAENHIHMNLEDAKKYGVEDNQIVKVLVNGERKAIIYSHIKVSDNGVLKFHIDIDEANAFLLKQDDFVEVVI